MAKAAQDARIALFIDFENLVTRTGFTDESFDIQPALDKLLERGKVVYQRAYCDWGRFPAAKQGLHNKGVELIDVPPSTRAGKNGADMRLVIDALELAYLREHVDTFVIASGDSDFCPLAYKLRENNRRVIGVAVKEATSPLFVRACDEFIYLRPKATRASKARAQPAASAEAPAEKAPEKKPRSRRGSAATKKAAAPPVEATPPPRPPAAAQVARKVAPQAQRAPAVVPELVREVVAGILARATGPVNPSAIKSAIVRRQPDFDVRDHGFSTFTRLLEALEREGILKRVETSQGQWNVVAAG
jgi:uncharacterized LabA/DUF88 family protein